MIGSRVKHVTYVGQMASRLANLLMVPLPYFCGNRLADRTQDAQVLHGMMNVLITRTLQ